ncbi:hypothetical protein DT076_06780 [Desertihabitans brevis]|uniref:Uncharacterized protein n=1 Tax=Desertihabitans brevis TaxID=2268447 RepID=A0A367YWZ4_9ACTN|nr:hypothetical protein [Desertihabitans brevis]RCK70350.1 hypothetical protein DT076_06780 [Desertihabitans brevis]
MSTPPGPPGEGEGAGGPTLWSEPSLEWAPPSGPAADAGTSDLVRRPWRLLLVALCLGALTGAGWVGWYQANSGWLVRPAPPGARVQVEGSTYRLSELYSTDLLVGGPGEEPQRPPPGTVFVVGRVQVDTREAEQAPTADGPVQSWCDLSLLGAGTMVWDPQAPVVRRPHPPTCAGRAAQTVEVVYRVPLRERDRIRGVLVRPTLGPGTTWLLQPPA